MKIFISWSGERSEALAKALREWFPLVLHFVEPWLSKSDIQAGERWNIEIAKELESCNFGVICITRENLNSPWILFEAGALAKSMQDGRVIPLLLDLDFKEISGPLSQFQAKKADNNGIKEIIFGLNKAYASPVTDTQLEKLYTALWNDLEKQIISIPKSSTPAKHTRPQGEILEELVSGVRNVEMRVREAMDEDPFLRKRRRLRFHPELMQMLMYKISDGPRDPINLLILASLLRDNAPWLYELALEAYRSVKAGQKEEMHRALHRFRYALDALLGTPYFDEVGFDKFSMRMFRSLIPEMMELINITETESEEKIAKNSASRKRDIPADKEG